MATELHCRMVLALHCNHQLSQSTLPRPGRSALHKRCPDTLASLRAVDDKALYPAQLLVWLSRQGHVAAHTALQLGDQN